jgi:phage baseplate assembly protein W
MTNLPCIKLPLAFENGLLDRTSKSDSIIDFVSLILSTKRGSIADAPDFGNALWEKDIGLGDMKFDQDAVAVVERSVSRNEQRLSGIRVEVKREADIERAVTVKGNYTQDGETREVAVEFDFFRT